MEHSKEPGPLLMQRMTIAGMPFHRWAESRHFMSADTAFHHLLVEMFGPHEPVGAAPKPFRMEVPSRPQGTNTLYGYGYADADELKQRARQYADPLMLAALPPESFQTKPVVTDWNEGQRLGFEIKVRPTQRYRHPDTGKRVEVDYYQYRLQNDPDANLDRCQAYCEWLATRLKHREGAVLRTARLHSYIEDRFWVSESSPAPLFPKAVIRGELIVTDSDAFNEVLKRGLGMYRAYGYGMLLLRSIAR